MLPVLQRQREGNLGFIDSFLVKALQVKGSRYVLFRDLTVINFVG